MMAKVEERIEENQYRNEPTPGPGKARVMAKVKIKINGEEMATNFGLDRSQASTLFRLLYCCTV